MSVFRIAWKNQLSGIDLSSSVEAESAYPITNMQSIEANAWSAFDMTGETELEILFSVTTPIVVNMIAIHNHNLLPDATIQLLLYSGDNQTGDEYDSTALPVMTPVPYGSEILGIDPLEGVFNSGQMKRHFSHVFEAIACRSGKLVIAAPTTHNNVILIDKSWLAYAHAPEDGPEWGFASTQIDSSVQQRKPGGGMLTRPSTPRRSLNINFGAVFNSERVVLLHILDEAAMGNDLWISMDAENELSMKDETTSIYCRTSEIAWDAAMYNVNNSALALEEN